SCTIRDQFAYIPSYIIGNLFFVVILFVFYSLWSVIYRDQAMIAGLTLTQTLWYLTFTESIELSKARVYRQIQDEVKDGSIAYALGRPYSYNGFKASRFFGEGIVKVIPIMFLGFIICTIFTGTLPGYWRALPFGTILILGGLVLNIMWGIIIGLLAFWTEEVTPFYWILQKLIFIAGGMFFPIDFFPEWLQGAAKTAPFAFSAYWPAITMVDFSYENFRTALCGQLFYITLLAFAAYLIFKTALKRIHLQGG
ncbi:MAG: ABC-2 family transporter protein, partial [Spirochaetales bacterium]|nr:ABC-2 family transporter protein [Spirochaetales bacterium]